MPPVPAAFADEIDGYLSYLELERGLSRNTAKSYESDLKQAAHFLRQHGVANWKKVTAKHLTAWLHWLSDRDFTASSQARKLSAVRMLCRHLVRERIRDDDPTELLAGPKIRRKLPQTLSTGEMQKLLAGPTGADAYAIRDRAMLELVYSSGLRASEICGLTLQQVDLDHGFVRVFGKGSKERVVPMLAWPSISWIARRSAPPPSRCVAKEWRRRCGLTGFSMPARAAADLTITQRVFRDMALPRSVMNSSLPVFGFTSRGRPEVR